MSNIEIINSSLITVKTFIDEYDFDKCGVLDLATYNEGYKFYSIEEITSKLNITIEQLNSILINYSKYENGIFKDRLIIDEKNYNDFKQRISEISTNYNKLTMGLLFLEYYNIRFKNEVINLRNFFNFLGMKSVDYINNTFISNNLKEPRLFKHINNYETTQKIDYLFLKKEELETFVELEKNFLESNLNSYLVANTIGFKQLN